jgi:hypothetical protein
MLYLKIIILYIKMLKLLLVTSFIIGSYAVRVIPSPDLHPLQTEFHPSSSVGGLRLAHVFVHESKYIINHHHLPKTEHDRRRMTGMYNITDGCCSLETERDRIRTAAALNFHIYPDDFRDNFDEETGEDKYGKQRVFNDGNSWMTWLPKNITGVDASIANENYLRLQEHLLTNYLTSDISTASWERLHNPIDKYNNGKMESVGVSMGVYEAVDGTQFFVFRGTYSMGDFENVLRMIKDWTIENTRDDIINAWVDAGQNVTSEMEDREDDGFLEECSLRAGATYLSYTGSLKLSMAVDDVSYEDIRKHGYWPLTKMMVRTLLPVDRDVTKDPTIYITGHSQGGSRASLVSMWLEKEDGEKYKTYSLSPIGVQCFSRQLSYLPGSSSGADYLNDVDPYIFHDQITSYKHPLDVFAMIDLQPGRVCHYGTTLLSTSRPGGSDLMSYFKRIVGYTGPQIYIGYTGPMLDVNPFNEEPFKNFAVTRYWTHSNIWMNILFAQSEFLKEDGTTDGGCWDAEIVPVDDPENICPSGNSNTSCNGLFLGMGVFAFICILLFPLVLFYGCYLRYKLYRPILIPIQLVVSTDRL